MLEAVKGALLFTYCPRALVLTDGPAFGKVQIPDPQWTIGAEVYGAPIRFQ
jgi:hypothetical protein